MSDLYWERIAAGHYETQYYTNGYKYMVTGEAVDWRCYYKYHTKDPDKRKWRRLQHGYSDRLKGAKGLCRIHNENPRRKFKIKGREEQGFAKPFPVIVFVEMYKQNNGEWKERSYGKFSFKADEFYESYSGEVTYLGDNYFDQLIALSKDEKEDLNELTNTLENRSA